MILDPSSASLLRAPFVAGILLTVTTPLAGQADSFVSLGHPELWAGQTAEVQPKTPGKAALLSAVVPGAGQWLQGQNRWSVYAAAEIWAWVMFFDRRREGRKLQERYRDLAWDVARRVSSGPRTEGSWEYYEALTRFTASGAYDADPTRDGVQPEENPKTFNGSVWVLAQEIFNPQSGEEPAGPGSPSYQRAFEYYTSRAYGPEFAWNWGTNTLYQEEYAGLIRASDEDLRGSTTMLGVILANHLLSAVDALVSGRLGIAGDEEPLLQFVAFPGPFSSYDVGLHVRLSIPDPS
jgi:hypothetical protein